MKLSSSVSSQSPAPGPSPEKLCDPTLEKSHLHESQVTINCQNGQLKEYRLGWLGWAAGLAAGAGDTHRTNVEQLYTETSFLIILTGTNIKPKIFPHNKLNKNVRFMPVVIVILSVQLSLGTALSRSLPSVECRVTNVGNLELKDLRDYPTFLPTWRYSGQFVRCPASLRAAADCACKHAAHHKSSKLLDYMRRKSV